MTAFGDTCPPPDSSSFTEEAFARLKSSDSELAMRLAELLERIRALGDEIKLLKKLPRPYPKPRGEDAAGNRVEKGAVRVWPEGPDRDDVSQEPVDGGPHRGDSERHRPRRLAPVGREWAERRPAAA